MSKWICVDVEADGPCPHLYSMVSFGAVVVEPTIIHMFYGRTAPVSENYREDALAVIRPEVTREQHLTYKDPKDTMDMFYKWCLHIAKQTPDNRLVFVSDNPAFDWQFINYYFHRFNGVNPFGFSARRVGDLFAGMQKNAMTPGRVWKKLRTTPHTHHPVDDARGVAEALLKMKELGLTVPF